MSLLGWSVQFKFVQRLPTAYGFVTETSRCHPEIMRSYTEPGPHEPGGAPGHGRAMLRAVDTRYTFEAAEGLRGLRQAGARHLG